MERGVVVVTGAGSGIGWASAKELASRGYAILAGVFDDEEARRIEDSGVVGVTPQLLDVTRQEQIDETAKLAATMVSRSGPLVGLVNSAGLVVAGPLEFLSTEDLRFQFEVNVFGLMAVTRALLPELRRSRGRVVNIGSVGGRLSVPFTGPYGASKFAVRALSDALRMELRPSGVQVTLIEPGPIATPIWERSIDAGQRRIDALPAAAREIYRDEIAQVFSRTRQAASQAIAVETVVDAVVDALLSPRAPAQVLVGAQARLQAFASRLPARLRDVLLLRAMGLRTKRG